MKLCDLLQENNDELIKKNLNTLYKGFRKGSFRLNTDEHPLGYGERPEYQNLDIKINYELSDAHEIILHDKDRKESLGKFFQSHPHTILVHSLKVWSEEISDKNMDTYLKKVVKNILKKRFGKIADTDLIFKPTAFVLRNNKWVYHPTP